MSRDGRKGRLSFGREKRLLLGLLALIAPLPLPLNEVLGWGWYLLFAVPVGVLLVRARGGTEAWLPVWAANLLAIAYLPLLFLDLTALSGGGVVGPVIRLGLFAVLVKLWSLRLERDKWHAALGIFFLFLAAAATSVHLSVVLYLLVFLAGTLLLLARFALLHLLNGFGHRDARDVPVPMAGFTALAVAGAVMVAIPLFALLPRVQNPYIRTIAGGGTGSEIGVTGFSDRVTLDSIGRVRTSREVALRLTWEEGTPPPEIRLKGGSFDRFDGASWQRSEVWRRIGKEASTEIRLPADGERPTIGEVSVWLQPLGAKGLPLPVEATAVDIPRRGLELGAGGALWLRVMPRRALEYRVAVAGGPVLWAPPPEAADGEGDVPPTLSTSGLTPPMVTLAREVAGDELGAAAKAEALERWLVENFTYTLDFVGRGTDAPLEDFLLTHRSGHCEYFATAMVLLLRSQGIHARLATGFLGGDRTPVGYYVVRQSNAHAWVEAWIPGQGWRTYDPTPAAGRPGLGQQSLVGLATRLYDNLVFQWDRYVLTYGVEDQVDFLYGFFRGIRNLVRSLGGGDGNPMPVAAGEPATEGAVEAASDGAAAGETGPLGRRGLTAALLLLALLVAADLWRRYRRLPTGTAAYRRLRRRIEGAGVPLSDATGPLAMERRVVLRFPEAADGTERVVRSYLRESFGGEELTEDEREGLRRALEQALGGMKRSAAGGRDDNGDGQRRRTA